MKNIVKKIILKSYIKFAYHNLHWLSGSDSYIKVYIYKFLFNCFKIKKHIDFERWCVWFNPKKINRYYKKTMNINLKLTSDFI
ncbi:MAG TPA: hypothetical protein VI911_08645 [Patescibacteria group bacterium]|nr:MAG: hypothetical protein UR43_C0005G0104 [candidate division TM6 bacterium GW2011_GWF2_33_332]HLD91064.1 hypothetical protein [Patescibacteria group bacterium]